MIEGENRNHEAFLESRIPVFNEILAPKKTENNSQKILNFELV
jgi:hypothetical protein